uniref:Uncharacterized protein n=1 Tax=Sciurus vulgaris TaxID=55149 RepID=A0A8D2B9B3_SCIVU
MAATALKWVISKRIFLKHLFPVQNGLYLVFVKNLHFLLFQMTIIAK